MFRIGRHGSINHQQVIFSLSYMGLSPMPLQVQTGAISHLLLQSLKYSYLAEVMRLRLHTNLDASSAFRPYTKIVEFHDAEHTRRYSPI